MSFRKTLITAGFMAFAVAVVACRSSVHMGELKTDLDAGPTTSFTDPTSSDAGSIDAAALLQCIGTECPAPLTTCRSDDGPTYTCGTDLSRDSKNCGACGNECLAYGAIHMTSRCVEGACALECSSPSGSEWRNCNGLIDDGCEVNTVNDPNNCGACGNVCPNGESCILGKCGCPIGRVECNGVCVDLENDDYNCGACDRWCDFFPRNGCAVRPPGTYYGCQAGTCDVLKCFDARVDCDGDLDQGSCGGNGCEVDGLTTRENCGACGVQCAEGLECIQESGAFECVVPCAKSGTTLCGGICVDVLNDPLNCGGCNAGCNAPGSNQASLCRKGVCSYECAPGFGDCNGDPTDGCETNLAINAGHCGACGNACEIAAGQPCIEGKCLMTECDGGLPTK